MKSLRLFLSAAVVLCLTAVLAFAQAPCEKLKGLALPDTTVISIEYVPAGPYRAPVPPLPPPSAPTGNPGGAGRGAPGGLGAPAGARGPAVAGPPQVPVPVPAYCRVALVLAPSKDSHIESEVWLPVEDWNGKLQVVGNGGWAGSISYSAMAAAVREGYATASTDTGHKANDNGGGGMFALGHPEKIIDFGYRSLHETTVKAKSIVAKMYGKSARYSYYNGCSTGGRQGLVEVTRYPEDFDAVSAGAPANPHIHLHASGMERSLQLMKIPQGALSQPKIESLAKAVLAACDALDGVKDGLISDPHKCHFDPASLLCKGADTDTCLTAPQVEFVKAIYADQKTKKGEIIWTGYEPGGELQYAALRTVPTQPAGVLDSIRILAYQDADWDWRTFDLDRDVALADEKAGLIDAHTYDLGPFKARGGKLLLYHGWADPAIPPGNTVNFYNGVLSKMGSKQDNWIRLFMVPGMGHCSGGAGPDQFNKMGVLERWREAGKAPDQILATHVTGGNVDRSRPLCPYPQVAVYKGTGSTNDADSFVCAKPK